MKQIVIDIAATGDVRIEAFGYQGALCESATKKFEEALLDPKARRAKRKRDTTTTEASNDVRLSS